MANHPGVADVPNVMIAAFDAAVPQGGAAASRSPSALAPLQGCAASPHGKPVNAIMLRMPMRTLACPLRSRTPAAASRRARAGPPAQRLRPYLPTQRFAAEPAARQFGFPDAPLEQRRGNWRDVSDAPLASVTQALVKSAGGADMGDARRALLGSAAPCALDCAGLLPLLGLAPWSGLSPMSLPRDPALASPPCQVRHPCKLECRCSMAAV